MISIDCRSKIVERSSLLILVLIHMQNVSALGVQLHCTDLTCCVRQQSGDILFQYDSILSTDLTDCVREQSVDILFQYDVILGTDLTDCVREQSVDILFQYD